jgi:CDP-6-deoxy-D-xylo-4-hexulose-3-dehydrase
MTRREQIRAAIRQLTAEFYTEVFREKPFIPGESAVPVSGRVFDDNDMFAIVDSGLDFWLTAGRFADLFEFKFAKFVGVRDARLVNSGSSANLLAVSVLTSPTLGERQLTPGDEVITVAAGFPTTVNPIVQNRLVPVFVDIELGTYNVDVTQLERALSPRTKALIFAHTLGNPFDASAVSEFARKHNLWLIEDCCDALGSTYRGRRVGTLSPIGRNLPSSSSHFAIGAATAGARQEKTILAARGLTGNWGACRTDTIISTHTLILVTTSRLATCRPRSVWRNWKSWRALSKPASAILLT